jgi:hypothetical protein
MLAESSFSTASKVYATVIFNGNIPLPNPVPVSVQILAKPAYRKVDFFDRTCLTA